jgi:hypothetical protein
MFIFTALALDALEVEIDWLEWQTWQELPPARSGTATTPAQVNAVKTNRGGCRRFSCVISYLFPLLSDDAALRWVNLTTFFKIGETYSVFPLRPDLPNDGQRQSGEFE